MFALLAAFLLQLNFISLVQLPDTFLLLEMVVPEVNQQLLSELEEMGFPKERAIRALHYSGMLSLEDEFISAKHIWFYIVLSISMYVVDY